MVAFDPECLSVSIQLGDDRPRLIEAFEDQAKPLHAEKTPGDAG